MKRAHDLFISYSHGDNGVAKAICTALEAQGVRCWFAENNIRATNDFNEDIVRAIDAARLFLVVVSDDADHSDYVKKELQQAVNLKKTIIPFCLSPVPSGFFDFHLSRCQRVDGTQNTLDTSIATLSTFVRARLRKRAAPPRPSPSLTPIGAPPAVVSSDAAAVAPFANPYDFSVPANQQTFKGRSVELD